MGTVKLPLCVGFGFSSYSAVFCVLSSIVGRLVIHPNGAAASKEIGENSKFLAVLGEN